MRILVYEYLTGGGLWDDPVLDAEQATLRAEGAAMRRALLEDLVAWQAELADPLHCPNADPDPMRVPAERLELVCLQDTRCASRLPDGGQPPVRWVAVRSGAEERAQLAAWAEQVDLAILIAPETGGRLLDRCRLVVRHGCPLGSPGPEFVALTMNKQRTAERLAMAAVPVPPGRVLGEAEPLPADFPYPAVLKPLDGCGGLGARRVDSMLGAGSAPPRSGGWRLERFCAGLPVSVAALCGPASPVLLAPCWQTVAHCRGGFHYQGGSLPLEPALAARADQLARRTLAALPPTRGYVGIDMILGPDTTGNGDVVLEVNPRLTTSYVGLRRATTRNLAAMMIRVALGQVVDGLLPFLNRSIQFSVSGDVTVLEQDDRR